MLEFVKNQATMTEDGAKVFVTGEINEGTVVEVQNDIELCKNAGVKQITFCINSPGGSVSDGMALYDIVSALGNIETVAEIQGLCASAATYLPLACDKITMTASSDMMLHEPEGGFYGTVTTATADLEYFVALRDRIIALYCSRTGLEPGEVEDILGAAKFMNAKRCKELNLIDEIIGEAVEEEKPAEEKPAEENAEKPVDEGSNDVEEENECKKPNSFLSFDNIVAFLKKNNISLIKAENDEFADQTEVVNSLTAKVKNLEIELEAKQKSYDEIVNRLNEVKQDIDKRIQLEVCNKVASMGMQQNTLPTPERRKNVTDEEFKDMLKEIYKTQGYNAAAKLVEQRENGEV